MFPDLSYLFNYLFGTPVDNFLSIFKTFGLLLVLAFIVSAVLLKIELIRKRKLGLFQGRTIEIVENKGINIGEIIFNGIFGFVLGWKVPLILQDISSFSQNPTGTIFSLKGSWLLGVVIAHLMIFLHYFLSKKATNKTPQATTAIQYPEHRLIEITMVAAFFGILGSKMFSIFENWSSFIKDPIQQLFAGSGLTIYGGLILAFIAVYFYVKRIGIKPLHMMDAVAPALIMGYVVGRMGCQLSGDGDWGIVATTIQPDWFIFPDWLWSFDYPHNVVNTLGENAVLIENCGDLLTVNGADPLYCTKLKEAVYPTPIYEIIMGILIFLILWLIRKRFEMAGMLFFLYVFLNGIERYFIEQIRVNEKYELLGLGWSLSQWIAFGLILIGLAGMLYLRRYGTVKTGHKRNETN